jgi:hypothetical protein
MLDVRAGAYDPIFRGGEYSDATQDGVKAFICSLQLRNVEIIAGVFPEHTGRHNSARNGAPSSQTRVGGGSDCKPDMERPARLAEFDGTSILPYGPSGVVGIALCKA